MTRLDAARRDSEARRMRCRVWGARGNSGARFCVYRNFLRRALEISPASRTTRRVVVESTPLLLHAAKLKLLFLARLRMQLVRKGLSTRMRPLALPLLALTLLIAQWSEPLKRIASTGSIVRPTDAPLHAQHSQPATAPQPASQPALHAIASDVAPTSELHERRELTHKDGEDVHPPTPAVCSSSAAAAAAGGGRLPRCCRSLKCGRRYRRWRRRHPNDCRRWRAR